MASDPWVDEAGGSLDSQFNCVRIKRILHRQVRLAVPAISGTMPLMQRFGILIRTLIGFEQFAEPGLRLRDGGGESGVLARTHRGTSRG